MQSNLCLMLSVSSQTCIDNYEFNPRKFPHTNIMEKNGQNILNHDKIWKKLEMSAFYQRINELQGIRGRI